MNKSICYICVLDRCKNTIYRFKMVVRLRKYCYLCRIKNKKYKNSVGVF